MSKGMSYEYSGTRGHIIAVASSFPKSPITLLHSGWEDISNPLQRQTGHWELKEKSTGLKIRFDKGTTNASGYKGIDHYHVYNPAATSNKNRYLDSNGNPVAKSSSKSHILPKGEKL